MAIVLGVSTTHDSGATVLDGDEVVAAVNEERFNRQKHYGYLPFRSIEYCLDRAGVSPADLDAVAFPSDVLRTDARLLLDCEIDETNVSQGSMSLAKRLTRNATETLRRASARDERIPDYARAIEFPDGTDVHLVNHHEAHAASAYYCCGHDDALVVTLDGLGDRLSGTVWRGEDGALTNVRRWDRTGSLGWFFGIVTEALGWWIGNGEGKTMGLASYAEPQPDVVDRLREICPTYEDGTLDEGYEFSTSASWQVHDTHHWSFDEAEYVRDVIDDHGRRPVAAAAQHLLEEQVMAIVEPWIERTGTDHLATAGGVFLNVQINERILRETDIADYFIFPNAGDGGLPTGAAMSSVAHQTGLDPSRLRHAYYGPDIGVNVRETLENRLLAFEQRGEDELVTEVADLLADGGIVAWCQGRMEYGPRALGNRSILIDPTRDDSMDRVNERVKFRDSWRPFAPSIIEEAAEEYLVDPTYDPFMITSCDVPEDRRDEIPAVTHVDGTTRPQIVRRSVNQRYWKLIDAFGERTGTPVLLNTSYNLSGDPIVCSPRDAITTFYDTGLDALVMGDYMLRK